MDLPENQRQIAATASATNADKPKRHRTLAQKWRLVSLPNKMTAIATIVIATFTVVLACVSYFQWREMNKSVMISQVDQRAWIGSPRIEQEMRDQGKITFNLIFKNVGKTPTTGLYIDWKPTPGESADIGKQCDAGKNQAQIKPGDFAKHSIIPGEEVPFPPGVMLSHQGRNDDDIATIKKMSNPQLVGCVVYRIQPDGTLHNTKFIAPLDTSTIPFRINVVYTIDPD
jgi:hypothetical protein